MANYNVDIAIIGAGTAGLTAAIYARRASKSAVIFEAENYGGQIITTPEIENYPGIKKVSGYKFATDLYEQATSLNATFVYDNILSIEGDVDTGFVVKGEFGSICEAKAVILACGAQNRHMGLVGEERMTGRGISYCATCDGAFYKDKIVAVYGGGNTALEDAIYLSNTSSKVYLIHRRDEFRGEKTLVDIIKKIDNIELVLSHTIEGLVGEKQLEAITVLDKKTNETRDIVVDGLFVAIGQVPNNKPFASLVTLDEAGYVVAGEDCKTNVPGIFTAGDGRTKQIRQLTTAASDGAIAALAACDLINRM